MEKAWKMVVYTTSAQNKDKNSKVRSFSQNGAVASPWKRVGDAHCKVSSEQRSKYFP